MSVFLPCQSLSAISVEEFWLDCMGDKHMERESVMATLYQTLCDWFSKQDKEAELSARNIESRSSEKRYFKAR